MTRLECLFFSIQKTACIFLLASLWHVNTNTVITKLNSLKSFFIIHLQGWQLLWVIFETRDLMRCARNQVFNNDPYLLEVKEIFLKCNTWLYLLLSLESLWLTMFVMWQNKPRYRLGSKCQLRVNTCYFSLCCDCFSFFCNLALQY